MPFRLNTLAHPLIVRDVSGLSFNFDSVINRDVIVPTAAIIKTVATQYQCMHAQLKVPFIRNLQ